MKQEFSTQWQSSSQPRKQRKFLANAPLHLKHRFLSANLSKSLRKEYGKRNLPLRKGDEVLVMRGTFRKKKAKVSLINLKRTRVVLEGIQRAKKDGSKVNVFFHPSILQIHSIHSDSKRIKKSIKAKSTETKQEQKVIEQQANQEQKQKPGEKSNAPN